MSFYKILTKFVSFPSVGQFYCSNILRVNLVLIVRYGDFYYYNKTNENFEPINNCIVKKKQEKSKKVCFND